MRIIKTSQYKKVAETSSVPIHIQDIPLDNFPGVFMNISGEATVSSFAPPRGRMEPDDAVPGGQFIDQDCEVNFYDEQGAPMQLDDSNSPVPAASSRTYSVNMLPPLLQSEVEEVIREHAEHSDQIETLPPGYSREQDPDWAYESQRDDEMMGY